MTMTSLGIGGSFRSRLDCYEAMTVVYAILIAPDGTFQKFDSTTSAVVKLDTPTAGFVESYIFSSGILNTVGTWRQVWVTDLGLSQTAVSRLVQGSNNAAIDAIVTGSA